MWHKKALRHQRMFTEDLLRSLSLPKSLKPQNPSDLYGHWGNAVVMAISQASTISHNLSRGWFPSLTGFLWYFSVLQERIWSIDLYAVQLSQSIWVLYFPSAVPVLPKVCQILPVGLLLISSLTTSMTSWLLISFTADFYHNFLKRFRRSSTSCLSCLRSLLIVYLKRKISSM